MDQTITLDKTFNVVMKRMVEKGRAPHYTDQQPAHPVSNHYRRTAGLV